MLDLKISKSLTQLYIFVRAAICIIRARGALQKILVIKNGAGSGRRSWSKLLCGQRGRSVACFNIGYRGRPDPRQARARCALE